MRIFKNTRAYTLKNGNFCYFIAIKTNRLYFVIYTKNCMSLTSGLKKIKKKISGQTGQKMRNGKAQTCHFATKNLCDSKGWSCGSAPQAHLPHPFPESFPVRSLKFLSHGDHQNKRLRTASGWLPFRLFSAQKRYRLCRNRLPRRWRQPTLRH